MEKKSNALAIVSLIFGIIGLVTCCLGIGIVFDVIAVVCGIVALAKKQSKGMSIIGIITGSIGLILCIVVLVMGGFAAVKDTISGNDSVGTVDKTSSTEGVSLIDSDTTKEKTISATIEEQTIYDDNGVIIKATSLDGNKLNFYIENNSTLNLGFNMHSYGVNGIMANNNIYDMSCSVAANSKANTTLYIDSDILDDYGVNDIKQISTHIWVYDEDDYFKEFDIGVATIDTDLSTGVLQKVPCDVLLEENGLVYSFVSMEDNNLVVSIENNTDSLYEVDMEDVVINDWAYDTDYEFDIRSIQIHPNYQAIITLDVDSEFLRTNNIENIESIVFDFNYRKDADYFQEAKSRKITYTK